MLKKWKRVATETLFKNKWHEYRHDTFTLPNGKAGNYYYTHNWGSVYIVAVDRDKRVVLHREYRYLFDRESVEFPAGQVGEGRTSSAAARAELAEEAGLKAAHLKQIGKIAYAVGYSTDWADVYVAWDVSPEFAERDETEEFEMIHATPEEIESMIQSGEMFGSSAIAAWHIARPHVLKLIDTL